MAVGIRKRPDALNERIGIAAKLTAKSFSEFPERNGHYARRARGDAYFLGAGAVAGAAAGAAAFE